MARSSFGLPEGDVAAANSFQQRVLEEVNECVVNCSLTYSEAMTMPVPVRHWWMLNTRKKKSEQEQGRQQTHASDGRQIIPSRRPPVNGR